jgi:hypothetical protein
MPEFFVIRTWLCAVHVFPTLISPPPVRAQHPLPFSLRALCASVFPPSAPSPQDHDIDRARADRNKQQGRRSDLLGVNNKSRLGNRGREYCLRN